MNRTLLFLVGISVILLSFVLLLFIVTTASAQRIPVNEWTINTPTYTVKGDGIAYETAPDVWAETDTTIQEDATDLYVDAAPLKWHVKKNGRDIIYTRDGLTTTFGFDGLYWFNLVTKAWTAIDISGSGTPTKVGETVVIADIYPGVDVLITVQPSGPSVSYSITDMAGWVANPYGADGVLGFWHELKSRGHGIKVDNVTWDGVTYTPGNNIKFSGPVKSFDIFQSTAEDATGSVSVVENAVVRAVNKDFFAQGVDSTWLSGVTLPVTVQ